MQKELSIGREGVSTPLRGESKEVWLGAMRAMSHRHRVTPDSSPALSKPRNAECLGTHSFPSRVLIFLSLDTLTTPKRGPRGRKRGLKTIISNEQLSQKRSLRINECSCKI